MYYSRVSAFMGSTPSSWLTMLENKERAPRNRTITLKDEEKAKYEQSLLRLDKPVDLSEVLNRTINQDLFQVMDFLPKQSVDLLFIDPPYNLNKTFNSSSFKKKNLDTYTDWLDAFLAGLEDVLKPTSSIYICCDWQSSPAVFEAVKNRFQVRNRITWEREKGRGASKNWKNSSEDIWFCTVSDAYTFNVDAVKLKRKVIAPYTVNGTPKDWDITEQGNYRLTHPSNLWTDLTIPFWSMPENTDHPTQKPEKLVAKAILASSNPGDVVFDPFLGSGTTSVVAKKLDRQYFGVELDEMYACLAEKRLEIADVEPSIQGYSEGVFWERNTLNEQVRSIDKKRNLRNGKISQQQDLFLLAES
jgi:site-specific DNA-methyltransferase (adenine-specific)